MTGKEITATIGGASYTSADPFGVDGGRVYLQLTSDMLNEIVDKSVIVITIPAKSFLINNSIENW